MKRSNFRKLHVDLNREPTINQRPWFIAGWLLAVAILIFAIWGFYAYKKRTALPAKHHKIALFSTENTNGTN